MKFISIAVAAAALGSFPAGAQTISLHPGESVTVRFGNGTPTMERSGTAEPMSKYEIYAVWRAETLEVPAGVKVVPPMFIMEGEGPPDAPRPTGNLLQLTMRRVPGPTPGSPDHTVLFLANGYDSMVRYQAVMNANSRSAPTDVCEAAPHLIGLEHWPYVIDQLQLSDLHLEEWTGAMRCE